MHSICNAYLHSGMPPNFENYPSDDLRRHFIRAYVEETIRLSGDVDDEDQEAMIQRECDGMYVHVCKCELVNL